MRRVEVPLNPSDAREEVGELHDQLADLGVVVAADEQSAKEYKSSTAAAVRAFRHR